MYVLGDRRRTPRDVQDILTSEGDVDLITAMTTAISEVLLGPK